jgi:hypothetical protein
MPHSIHLDHMYFGSFLYLQYSYHPLSCSLFIYLMSENVDWIHKNSHQEVDPHTFPKLKNCFLVVHRCKVF